MAKSLNTFVDFVGDFHWPHSIDDLPGKEVAELLAAGLKQRGIEVLRITDDRPDIGHYVKCAFGNQLFSVCATVDDWQRVGRWQLLTCPVDKSGRQDRSRSANRSEAFEGLLIAIDETLHASPQIRDIRWFPQFEEPRRLAKQTPDIGPVRDVGADHRGSRILREVPSCLAVQTPDGGPVGDAEPDNQESRIFGFATSDLGTWMIFILVIAVAVILRATLGNRTWVNVVIVIWFALAWRTLSAAGSLFAKRIAHRHKENANNDTLPQHGVATNRPSREQEHP